MKRADPALVERLRARRADLELIDGCRRIEAVGRALLESPSFATLGDDAVVLVLRGLQATARLRCDATDRLLGHTPPSAKAGAA